MRRLVVLLIALTVLTGCGPTRPTASACDWWDQQVTGWALADVHEPGWMTIKTRVWSPEQADLVHSVRWHVVLPDGSHVPAGDWLSRTATNVIATGFYRTGPITHDRPLPLVIDSIDTCKLDKAITPLT